MLRLPSVPASFTPNLCFSPRSSPSSLLFDKDGDLAHEFYDVTKKGLRRITEGLVPQVNDVTLSLIRLLPLPRNHVLTTLDLS